MKKKINANDIPSLDSLLKKWKPKQTKSEDRYRDEAAFDLAGFIRSIDKLHSIKVQGAIPSFNDGEPCRFSIHRIYLNGFDLDNFDDDNDPEFSHSEGWPAEDFLRENILVEELVPGYSWTRTVYVPAFDKVKTSIYQMKTLLEACSEYGLELDVWEEPDGNIYWEITNWDCGY